MRATAAEMIGTFALVFAGCGAIVVEAQTGALGHVGVCLTFGLVITAMIFATGHLSGAHFNPAVTLAFALIGRHPWSKVPAYIVGQLLAALLAAALLGLIVGTDAGLGATIPAIAPLPALALEAVLTFFLMFVITAVATDARVIGSHAAIPIGATVGLCALMGGPLTGASMNPARSLGPALVAGVSTGQWLYVVGPVLGAALGAGAYQLIRGD
jgi:aquaporin NIP